MKIIYLFEEFTNKTLSKNNTIYNTFLNKDKRSSIVAWENTGSQERNFKIVTKYIKNGDSVLDYGCGIGDFIEYLNINNIKISNYLGVDINDNFIKIAKETYTDYNFKTINDINQINGKWDDVCAIGVFTWYIIKEEFIETVYKLYDLCNKRLILTLLEGETPYDYDDYSKNEEDSYWDDEYRYFSEALFGKLFPELNIIYDYKGPTILIKIEK